MGNKFIQDFLHIVQVVDACAFFAIFTKSHGSLKIKRRSDYDLLTKAGMERRTMTTFSALFCPDMTSDPWQVG